MSTPIASARHPNILAEKRSHRCDTPCRLRPAADPSAVRWTGRCSTAAYGG